MSKSPKALYIHIPFCQCLCDYCDFVKLQHFHIFAKKYLSALKKEIDHYHINHLLDTIYIGGGTPTSLEDSLFEQLLKMVFPLTKNVKEYTIEANPESLSDNKLLLMKQYGVNRISIGVESTHDSILRSINRKHLFGDVKAAIKRAKDLGFNNINVDLIIGLPNVTIDLLKEDIINLLSLNIEHISCYSLTVHEHTVFHIKKIKEPSEDYSRDSYDMINNLLTTNGFQHYEVSNWCKKGYESIHNLTYWRNERYYGLGLGASGFINNIRYTNTKSINEYNRFEFIKEKEYVSIQDEEEYYIMLNLRTMFGIDYLDYQERFGKDFKNIHQRTILDFIQKGLLIEQDERLFPTHEGMMILDSIIIRFISE